MQPAGRVDQNGLLTGQEPKKFLGQNPLDRCCCCCNISLATGCLIIGVLQAINGGFVVFGLFSGFSTLSTAALLIAIFQCIYLPVGIFGIRAGNGLQVDDAKNSYYGNVVINIVNIARVLVTVFDGCESSKKYNFRDYEEPQPDCSSEILAGCLYVLFSLYFLWVTFSLYARVEVGDVLRCRDSNAHAVAKYQA
mmetsp:Transcript_1659/g.1761  ORF Transcript_1659/g.1761 Transcript_1659/m.1761 type:complete len:194 (+) Transcript_1659:36-617(+)